MNAAIVHPHDSVGSRLGVEVASSATGAASQRRSSTETIPMKTTYMALAIVLGLVPTLAAAGPISGALNDAIQQEAISDSIGDAIGGSSDGVYSQPLNDAITGPNGVYSDDLNDVIIGNNANGQPGGATVSRDAKLMIAK